MSQYPPPYQSPYQPGSYPGGGFAPYVIPYDGSNPLAPARRASIMLWTTGGIGLLAALCCGASGVILTYGKLPPELRTTHQQAEAKLPFSVSTLFTAFSVLLAVAGMLSMLFGFLVRSGTIGRVRAGLVFASLMVLLLALYIAASALVGLVSAEASLPDVLSNVCVCMVPLALYGLALFWLIQAARNASAVASLAAQQQAQYAAQYWQYQQAQQAYGYGQHQQQPSAAPQAPVSPDDEPGKPGG